MRIFEFTSHKPPITEQEHINSLKQQKDRASEGHHQALEKKSQCLLGGFDKAFYY